MTLRQLLFILSLLCLPASSLAARTSGQPADSVSALSEHLSLWGQVLQGTSDNPALMQRRYTTSLSDIALRLSQAGSSEAAIYQLGDGHTLMGLEATSYLRLSERSTVWGEASYRTGTRRHILWNSTADYALLYPYVMADTLGGNLTSERYTFGGGWAGRIGQRFTIGAQMRFRAEHEYRTYDPRPRSIVTDLTVGLGATAAWRRYTVGANVGGRFYKQTNSVKFFREEGVIPEYQMSGLAMDYKRFSGRNASGYYKASGVSAGLDVRPVASSGLYVSGRYDFTPFKRILPEFNAVPITSLYLQQAGGEAGWKQRHGRLSWAAWARADYERRLGDEHIAGNSSAAEYRVIEVLTMYHASQTTLTAGAAVNHEATADSWTLRATAGYTDSRTRHEMPARHLNYRKALATVEAGWQHRFGGGSHLTCQAGASVWRNLKADMLMPYESMDSQADVRHAMADLADHTYATLSAHWARVGGSVRYDMPLPGSRRYGLYGEAAGHYSTQSTGWHGYDTQLAVGLTF